MKLSQDTKVVNALNDILEGIDYLEYSESKSKNQDFLHVDLTDPERDRNFSDIEDVIFKLRKSTGRKFYYASEETGKQNLGTAWKYFMILEKKDQ